MLPYMFDECAGGTNLGDLVVKLSMLCFVFLKLTTKCSLKTSIPVVNN